MQIFFNEATKIKRSQFLGAVPHQRTADRVGCANGFKPKSMKSRVVARAGGAGTEATIRHDPSSSE